MLKTLGLKAWIIYLFMLEKLRHLWNITSSYTISFKNKFQVPRWKQLAWVTIRRSFDIGILIFSSNSIFVKIVMLSVTNKTSINTLPLFWVNRNMIISTPETHNTTSLWFHIDEIQVKIIFFGYIIRELL